MPRFGRAMKQFFRASKRSEKALPPLPQGPELLDIIELFPPVPQTTGEIIVEDSPVAQNRPESPCTTAEHIPEAQSSTETIIEAVDGEKGRAADQGKSDESVEEEEEEWDEGNNEEGGDASETLQLDLAHSTQLQMIVDNCYVALSDDDLAIAALRTPRGQRFTHIVRLDFTRPANGQNIRLSHWSTRETCLANNGPRELRITFPISALHYSDEVNTTLTPKQLSTARDYIAVALPHRNPDWETSRLDLPHPVRRGRALIVGPPSRQADVLAIVLCYLTFLTGIDCQTLWRCLQENPFILSPWRDQSLEKHTYERVERAARNYK